MPNFTPVLDMFCFNLFINLQFKISSKATLSMMEQIYTWPFKIPKTFLLVLLFLVNVLLSILIVLLNKTIYTYYGYPNLTMTCIHFAFTSFGLTFSESIGIFRSKPRPLKDTLSISVAFCAFVILNNLSLQFNTVGTCTTIKCLTMPCVVFIQTFYYKRTFPVKIKVILVSQFINTLA